MVLMDWLQAFSDGQNLYYPSKRYLTLHDRYLWNVTRFHYRKTHTEQAMLIRQEHLAVCFSWKLLLVE